LPAGNEACDREAIEPVAGDCDPIFADADQVLEHAARSRYLYLWTEVLRTRLMLVENPISSSVQIAFTYARDLGCTGGSRGCVCHEHPTCAVVAMNGSIPGAGDDFSVCEAIQ
jgi:hypothetical protein